jgi:hypothetical protein
MFGFCGGEVGLARRARRVDAMEGEVDGRIDNLKDSTVVLEEVIEVVERRRNDLLKSAFGLHCRPEMVLLQLASDWTSKMTDQN